MQNCCYRIGGMMFSRCGNGKKRLRDASKLLEDRLEDLGFERKSTSLYVAEIQKVAGILEDMGDFLRN